MNEFRRRIAVGLIITVSISGCASYQPVASNAIHEGDRVRVTTVGGETFQIRVTEVNDEQLSGEQRNVLREDIARLEREVEGEYSALKWIMVGIAAAVLTSKTPSPSIGGLSR